MLDPIGGFERIKDFFISYVETAFRISSEETAGRSRALLESDGALATAPFIEPVVRCEQYKDPLEKLISDKRLSHLSEAGRKAFVELALSGLFEGERADGPIKRKSTYNPYIDQVEMLFRGSNRGKPGIVTSGTGSGKTESFMLPRSGDACERGGEVAIAPGGIPSGALVGGRRRVRPHAPQREPASPQGAPRDHPLSDERAGRRPDGPSGPDAGLG
jgi:hypothetical protein